MQLTGSERINAPREAVWRALNDPDVLRRSIPGCVALEQVSPDCLKATVEIKVGPIGARFQGQVLLSDQVAPESYTISGQGQGGTVGSAKGAAKVRLDDVQGQTELSYSVDAQVGGRLAQLGGPIIDATARQLAGKFFRSFAELVTESSTVAPVAAVPAANPPGPDVSMPTRQAPVAARPGGLPVVWLLALTCTALAGYLVGHASGAGGQDWMGLAIGLLILVVAAAAFEFGRKSAVPALIVEGDLVRHLLEGARE